MTKQNLGGAADLRLPFFGTPSTPPAQPVETPMTLLPAEAPDPMLPWHATATDVPHDLGAHAGLFTELESAPVPTTPNLVLEVQPRAQAAIEADLPTPDDSARRQLWGDDEIPTFSALMGGAGCGKTYLARQLVEQLPGVELAATTGIAAINLGGTTVNSLLGYFDTASLQEAWMSGRLRARLGKLWQTGTKVIVLDEVSMLDGDQLTFLKQAIDETNTKEYVLKSRAQQEWEAEAGTPSLKLLLVGDFAQLPPVKAPFAFESPEWDAFGAHTTVLTEIRRQSDADFIRALRAARVGDAKTVLEYFGPTLQTTTADPYPGVTLLAKNESVDKYNWLRYSKLPGPEQVFLTQREGELRTEWGGPPKASKDWGIPERLPLKIGALVMILANEKIPGTRDLLYVNGDLGEIVEFGTPHRQEPTPGSPVVPRMTYPSVFVRLQRTGQVVEVDYIRRERLMPIDAGRRTELRQQGLQDRLREEGKKECVGWVEYLPVRLAYATTVHKSQGLSLDHVQVTLGDHFFKTPGMLYVALSRARTPQGLRLVGSPTMLAERCTVHPKLVGRFL